VDLFVKASNDVAVEMYRKLGYDVFQTVEGYYSGPNPEDCLGRFCRAHFQKCESECHGTRRGRLWLKRGGSFSPRI
jgi:ribosomal protein S18 acetylase RimI-like enzyme